MAEITYQMVLSTLQTAELLVGIFYYVTTLRNAQKTRELTLQSQELTRKAQEHAVETRQAQIFLSIIDTFRSTDFMKQWHLTETARWKDFDDYQEKYSPENNPEVITASTSVLLFFESVGTLVRKKLIDIDLIDGQIAIALVAHWRRWEPIIFGDREYFQSPDFWSDFEYIYNELDKTGKYTSTRSPHEIKPSNES